MNDHELDSNSCGVESHATRIYQSKMVRKTAKANVTRKMNEITELVKYKDVSNLERVQSVYCNFEEALRKFDIAQGHYHANLTNEDVVVQ